MGLVYHDADKRGVSLSLSGSCQIVVPREDLVTHSELKKLERILGENYIVFINSSDSD